MGSVSMALPIYMIPHTVPYRYTGEFVLRKSRGDCWVFICGFVARDDGPKGAYLPARHLQETLLHAADSGLRLLDRYDMLQTIWNVLRKYPKSKLGTDLGTDLSMLIAVGDARGVNLSATGLSGLWGESQHGVWLPMVPHGNPILSARGIEDKEQGSLFVAEPPVRVIATTHVHKASFPTEEERKHFMREER